MADELFSFDNPVCEDGYYWGNRWPDKEPDNPVTSFFIRGEGELSAPEPGERFLLPRLSASGELSPRAYDVFRDTALFRKFAALPQEDAAIAGFASKYGLLGRWAVCTIDDESVILADPRSEWINEISRMRELVRVWEAIEAGDKETVRHYIQTSTFSPGFQSQWPRERVGEEYPQIWLDRPAGMPTAALAGVFRRYYDPLWRDPFQFALSCLVGTVNYQIRTRMAVSIVTRQSHSKSRPIESTSSKPAAKLRIGIAPDDLLTALWLQFARSITGQKHFHACAECGVSFEVAARQTNRSDKRFCSDACRSRSHRKKKTGTRSAAPDLEYIEGDSR